MEFSMKNNGDTTREKKILLSISHSTKISITRIEQIKTHGVNRLWNKKAETFATLIMKKILHQNCVSAYFK